MSKSRTSSEGRRLLIVVSAPSGAGKTTLCERLLREFPDMARSISCTTRPKRPGETDGRDYHFVTEREFEREKNAGGLLEYAVVHGHCYGTPRKRIEDALAAGKDVLLAIDVQGARSIRNAVAGAGFPGAPGAASVDIFVKPPSLETLRNRLTGRNQDSAATVALRLKNAETEMACAGEFMYRIVNDDLDRAHEELKTIILTERRRINEEA